MLKATPIFLFALFNSAAGAEYLRKLQTTAAATTYTTTADLANDAVIPCPSGDADTAEENVIEEPAATAVLEENQNPVETTAATTTYTTTADEVTVDDDIDCTGDDVSCDYVEEPIAVPCPTDIALIDDVVSPPTNLADPVLTPTNVAHSVLPPVKTTIDDAATPSINVVDVYPPVLPPIDYTTVGTGHDVVSPIYC